MGEQIIEHVGALNVANLSKSAKREITPGVKDVARGDKWELWNGDCVEVLRDQVTADSVDLSVYSPPFATLFTYSDDIRDMGNNRDHDAFFEQFGFFVSEMLRVTKPGRLTCVHVQQLTTRKNTEGHIGLRDFRGRCIQMYIDAGWQHFGEVAVDKCPQAQAIRTKAHSLMFCTLNKDRSNSRPGLADFVLIFKKPGENSVPILSKEVDNETWIKWARPIWYGIQESNTLNTRAAKSEKDERHICLAAGSLVLTRDGYIPIQEVEVGDMVLTHMGRWMPVTGKRCVGARPIIRVCAQGVADLRVTPDHKLWTRKAEGHHPCAFAKATEPDWIPAEKTLSSYLNLKLPPVEESELTEREWWVIGRWLGDGHKSVQRHSGKRGGLGSFVISCSHSESDELLRELDDMAGHSTGLNAERKGHTATQVALKVRDEVKIVLNRCGLGATGKRVPAEALCLSSEKAESLLSGYLSADGHFVERHQRWCASSVSRALLLGMAMVAQRARGRVASVYAGRPAGQSTIQGRTVNVSQDWIFAFRNEFGYRQSGWIGDDGAWKKVRKINDAGEAEVWDISVAEDASFTAEGCIVKNCPLQLDLIERCIKMWSNPGEHILSPFAGIGSEGHEAIRLGRRFTGIELKPEYWQQAQLNIQRAEHVTDNELSLFSDEELSA